MCKVFLIFVSNSILTDSLLKLLPWRLRQLLSSSLWSSSWTLLKFSFTFSMILLYIFSASITNLLQCVVKFLYLYSLLSCGFLRKRRSFYFISCIFVTCTSLLSSKITYPTTYSVWYKIGVHYYRFPSP